MAVDPEWLRRLQQKALAGAQQNPVQNFNPEMMAANASIPNPQFAGSGLGGMARRGAIGLQNGLGRLQQAMFPIDSTQAAGMSAEDIRQYRNQAMMKMGLGMMGAAGQGARGGEALAHGYGLAQGGMNEQLQQRMQNARVQKQDQRVEARDAIEDERYAAEDAYRREQSAAQMELERQQFEESKNRFNQNLELDKRGLGLQERRLDLTGNGLGRPPEVRVTDRGMFERQPDGQWSLVPGTEPTGVSGRPIPQGMANDMKTNASVMNQIDQVLPQLRGEDGKFNETAKEAFGARNAVIDWLTPDAISDNVKNTVDPEGTDLRSIVTNLNSYVVKERNGAAVTVAEFARQRGFLPTDKDSIETIEKKLTNLRKAIADEQQYMLDFAESQGYRPPPGQMGGAGGWSIEEIQ